MTSQSGSATNGKRQGGDGARPRDPLRERGGEAEQEQRRRPFREHDVLEQVRGQEVAERERLERRDERGEDQREPGRESDDAGARRREAA